MATAAAEHETSVRRELGGFLRAHRERLAPEEVGLPRTSRRRTSGLRREEVAALSGVSVAWYTWLEQGRVDTSRQVLDAVARALRLDAVSHRHALALAGFAPVPQGPPDRDPGCDSGLRALLDSWPDSPALLLGPGLDVLAWNRAHAALWPDPAELAEDRRNLLLLLVTDARHQRLLPGWEPVAMDLYRHFRTRADRSPGSSALGRLAPRLHAARPDLAHWWACRSVGDFAPRTVGITVPGERLPRAYDMTLLLAPQAPDAALLVQTPRPTSGRRPTGRPSPGAPPPGAPRP
ncbi:helix-turn-helix domain-containing protein [Streptomyces sp. NPDC002564]|uniref:helix-turn-helix domain-containing protein n=1 Tax=Streptomyces sp. NPDC002564 TaxID=3364649 RepID=UPI003684A81A